MGDPQMPTEHLGVILALERPGVTGRLAAITKTPDFRQAFAALALIVRAG